MVYETMVLLLCFKAGKYGICCQGIGQGLTTDQSETEAIASEIEEPKLKQPDSEFPFPIAFGYVPRMHHILIIQKCKTIEEALFYIQKTIENGWSRRELEDNLQSDLYNVSGKAITNYPDRLPLPQGKLAQELTKSNYDLRFISLPVICTHKR